jgi:GINS complex subunit 4
MADDWDAEYDAAMARAGLQSTPSFIERARNAPPDDDDVPMPAATVHLGLIQPEAPETPLQKLMRHWMNERHAPDILPAQEVLLGELLDHIRKQSDTVQLLRGDPASSEEEHMRIMLAQTEVERVKFIVRSYMRTRLYKIERFARYITTNADVQRRISTAEQEHASRHANITDRHFHYSVLQSLPPTQAALDDGPIFVPPMITEPDKRRPVFVHALETCPPVRLPDGTSLRMDKGHISLMPYFVVEQLVARGEVELV